jgi:ATP-dependent DNA helicase UvrD/PcrA
MAYYKRGGGYSKPYDPNKKKSNWNPNYKKSTTVPGSQYKPVSHLSPEQNDIREAVIHGSGSVMVDAYAGTGKTTLCTNIMHGLVANGVSQFDLGYIIYASRNKDEAVGKCPADAMVKTAHGFGLQALSKALHKKVYVDKDKFSRIATALVGPDDERAEERYMVEKGISLGMDYLATTPEHVIAIIDKHGLETCSLTASEYATKVLEGMEVSAKQPEVVGFSDMTWLPLKLNIQIPKSQFLFADECQDLNLARIELVLRAIAENGKAVLVGDRNQSVFGFSGADTHALDKLKERSHATTMPLHRTFRCGRAIVELAKQYVPDYIADESCPEGEVSEVAEQSMMKDDGAGPGDFILSRTNAPITKIAMQLLKQGRKCNIQGRDLGKNLNFMIKRSRAKTVAEFLGWLEDWKNGEIERLSAKNKDYEHIVDKAECLEAFCFGESLLVIVQAKISEMFDDKDNDESRVILSTVHRAKGLERSRVWLLEKSFVCKPKTEEDRQQEKNIRYVAFTRAKQSLFLVS